jgi:futalosine hydrolase
VILLACAVARELDSLGGRPDVDALVTGVGPVEAAAAVAHALAVRRYALVVNAGIAGAFDGAARIGDGVVVADDSFELGREDGRPIALPDGERVVETARSDAALVERLSARGFTAVRGITVARVTSSEATAERLARRGAQVESMEGFGVLRACERAGVAAVELRGISNRVGARERAGWDFAAGILGLTRIVEAFFDLAGAPA